ncbi:MAG: hypothetical protein ACXVHC_08570 [Frankiaceae bacterium]
MARVPAPWLSDRQAFDLARSAGCAPAVGPTPSGRRWHVVCSCGFDSPTTKATKVEAVRQIVWHMRKVAERLQGPNRLNGGTRRVVVDSEQSHRHSVRAG